MPPLNPFGTAASDLGLGDMLGAQQKDETEEMRRKRMLQQQQQRLAPAGSAAQSLFGSNMPGAAGSLLGGFSGR